MIAIATTTAMAAITPEDKPDSFGVGPGLSVALWLVFGVALWSVEDGEEVSLGLSVADPGAVTVNLAVAELLLLVATIS